MRKTLLLAAALCLAVGMAQPSDAKGPDFARLTAKNIAAIQARADDYCEDMQARADEVVAKIQALQQAGRDDRAEALADRAINQITRRNDQIILAIERSGELLANLLEKIGQTDLADALTAAYDEATAKIQTATDNAIATIEEAFYGGAE